MVSFVFPRLIVECTTLLSFADNQNFFCDFVSAYPFLDVISTNCVSFSSPSNQPPSQHLKATLETATIILIFHDFYNNNMLGMLHAFK